MHCKTCDYPLWQITDRRCPECGTPFVPSEFEFILNSVKFCCPHCEQDYYGTGEKGHLVPRSFACVKCGQQIDMDQMVLVPADGVTERQTEVTVVPWVERRERNWFTAFFVTMGMAIANPNRTIDAVPEASTAGRAIAYMWLHTAAQMILSGMCFVLGVVAMGISAASGTGFSLGIFGGVLIAILVVPLLALAWAGLAHAVLRVTGPTSGPFRRTLQAICYSSGNGCPMLIPCLGVYISPAAALWWVISAAFMVRKGQRVSGGRAAAATVVPIVLVIGLVVGSVVALAVVTSRRTAARSGAIPSSAGNPMTGTAWTDSNHAAYGMSNRLQMVKLGAGGVLPPHGAEMVLDNRCWPGEFVVPDSATPIGQMSVEGTPLASLMNLPGGAKKRVRQLMHEDTALDGPSHRVGDWVFTHTGITPDVDDDQLWLAVGWWDPAFNPSDPADVPVAMSNYKYAVFATTNFDAALAVQNQLRAKHGLPPLPHPRDVKSGVPAKPTKDPGAESDSPPAEP